MQNLQIFTQNAYLNNIYNEIRNLPIALVMEKEFALNEAEGNLITYKVVSITYELSVLLRNVKKHRENEFKILKSAHENLTEELLYHPTISQSRQFDYYLVASSCDSDTVYKILEICTNYFQEFKAFRPSCTVYDTLEDYVDKLMRIEPVIPWSGIFFSIMSDHPFFSRKPYKTLKKDWEIVKCILNTSVEENKLQSHWMIKNEINISHLDDNEPTHANLIFEPTQSADGTINFAEFKEKFSQLNRIADAAKEIFSTNNKRFNHTKRAD